MRHLANAFEIVYNQLKDKHYHGNLSNITVILLTDVSLSF